MSQNSVLKSKSFAFAIRVINLYKYLINNKREFVVSKQLLRSGTAIGALIREAEFAESRDDFKHKLNVGLKEANESVYWLNLLAATNFISGKMFESIIFDANEIVSMLVASIKTLKNNPQLRNKKTQPRQGSPE